MASESVVCQTASARRLRRRAVGDRHCRSGGARRHDAAAGEAVASPAGPSEIVGATRITTIKMSAAEHESTVDRAPIHAF